MPLWNADGLGGHLTLMRTVAICFLARYFELPVAESFTFIL